MAYRGASGSGGSAGRQQAGSQSADSEVQTVVIDRIIHHKAIGFGRTVGTQESVFIPPAVVGQARLQERQTVELYLSDSTNPKSRYNALGRVVRPREGLVWDKWQTDTALPETDGGQQQPDVAFACYHCGSQVVAAQNIFKLKGGAIWTKKNPPDVQPYGAVFRNPSKNVNCQQLSCRVCENNVGTWYPEPYEGLEDEKEFPCAKLVYARAVGRSKAQHTVLVGEKDKVLAELSQVGGGLKSTVAVNKQTHDAVEAMRAQVAGMGLGQ